MDSKILDWEKLDDKFNAAWDNLWIVGCPLFLLILLAWDVRTAHRTNSHWVPARVLSLNAFTIVMLNQAGNVFKGISTAKNVRDLLALQYMIDFLRLMRCAFMAYIVPEVAQFGFRKTKEYLGTFTIVVVTQMAYQMYLLIHNPFKPAEGTGSLLRQGLTGEGELPQAQVTWFIVSTASSFSALSLFLWLLFTSVGAAKSIKSIALNNMKSITINKNEDDFFCKLWLIIRCCQTNFLMARSYLVSAAAMLMTIVIGISLVKLVQLRRENLISLLDNNYRIVLVLDLLFVFATWAVVMWRFFSAVYYFPRIKSKNYMSKYVRQSEHDLWTEMERLRKNIDATDEDVNRVLIVLHYILQPLIWVSLLCIQAGKLAWMVLDFVFGRAARKVFMNEETVTALRFLKNDEFLEDEDYAYYIQSLKDYTMLGESPYSLWEANFTAFKKLRRQISLGKFQALELWSDIQKISGETSIKRSDLFEKWHLGYTETDTESVFEDCRSWKMEVVWLLTMILSWLCKSKPEQKDVELVDTAINVCVRMWSVLKLVDGDEIQTLVADTQFHRLRLIWRKYKDRKLLDEGLDMQENTQSQGDPLLLDAVWTPVEVAFGKLKRGEEGKWDFTDWKKQDLDKYMYEKWKSWVSMATEPRTECLTATDLLQYTAGQGDEPVALLAFSLQHCIRNDLRRGIIERCRVWSTDLKESEMFDAAIEVGKAQLLMDKCKSSEKSKWPAVRN